MRRRDFPKKGTEAAGLAAPHRILRPRASSGEAPKLAPIAKRPLGKTGERLSIIGLGGIVVMNMRQSRANNLVAEAFDRGINYFDVAPSYGDAQQRLGPALEPYRKRSFLACRLTSGPRAALKRNWMNRCASCGPTTSTSTSFIT